MNVKTFVSKNTNCKPHVRCMTNQQLWLNLMLCIVATKDNGLSKSFETVDSYVLPHLKNGEWIANNSQIQKGINNEDHYVSLHTVERATSNLCSIVWEDNMKPFVIKHRVGRYGKYVKWFLNPLFIIKHNPNNKEIVKSYRIKSQAVVKLRLKNKLSLMEDKKQPLISRIYKINHKEDSIKWALQQSE